MADPNQRRTDALRRQELADASARAEAAAAQELLDEFVADLTGAGAPAEPLTAMLLNGTRVRTDRTGWYLNAGRTVAVGTDGAWLPLTVPGSRLARFTGVRLTPGPPSLVVGRGGRDGESGDLADFLARARERYLGR